MTCKDLELIVAERGTNMEHVRAGRLKVAKYLGEHREPPIRQRRIDVIKSLPERDGLHHQDGRVGHQVPGHLHQGRASERGLKSSRISPPVQLQGPARGPLVTLTDSNLLARTHRQGAPAIATRTIITLEGSRRRRAGDRP